LKILRKIQLFFRSQPRYIAWFLKVLVVFLFGLLLWYEIFQRENFQELKAVFLKEMRGENVIWLYLTLILMPINWATETLKWLPLIKLTEPISFKTGFKAVLAGVTFSLFMPNRVGEFGGRILFLRRRNALKGMFTTFVGSWAQQTVLITFGFFGFAYFLIDLWKVEFYVLQAVFFIGFLTITLLFFLFLNLEMMVPIFKKISFLYRFPRLIKGVSVIRTYKRRDLAKTLMWAFIRYAIYSLQYYMMLRFFGIEVPILRGLSCIATIYLLQTSIPLPPIISLLARGEVAIKIWGLFHANEISILAATFTLWVINLILPSFIGLILILNANLLKTIGFNKPKNIFKSNNKKLEVRNETNLEESINPHVEKPL
jgi:Lysylphosphatidylglycerol synthase TM region